MDASGWRRFVRPLMVVLVVVGTLGLSFVLLVVAGLLGGFNPGPDLYRAAEFQLYAAGVVLAGGVLAALAVAGLWPAWTYRSAGAAFAVAAALSLLGWRAWPRTGLLGWEAAALGVLAVALMAQEPRR